MTLRTLALALACVPWAALCLPTPAAAQSDDLTRRHEQMLYTVVQVTAGSARDSGSVIHSENHGDQ